MIVDLTRSGFANLRLIVSFEASFDGVKRSWESAGLPGDGHWFGDDYHCLETAAYRKGGQNYRVDARLTIGKDGNSSFVINYVIGDIRRTMERRSNLTKMELFLDDLASVCSVVCLGHTDVPIDRFRPIIGLPLLEFNGPNAYFDEVRGIRLVKLKANDERDSVALDLQVEGELHVYLQTTYTSNLGSDLASKSLGRLVTLKDRSIVAIQPDNGGQT